MYVEMGEGEACCQGGPREEGPEDVGSFGWADTLWAQGTEKAAGRERFAKDKYQALKDQAEA